MNRFNVPRPSLLVVAQQTQPTHTDLACIDPVDVSYLKLERSNPALGTTTPQRQCQGLVEKLRNLFAAAPMVCRVAFSDNGKDWTKPLVFPVARSEAAVWSPVLFTQEVGHPSCVAIAHQHKSAV